MGASSVRGFGVVIVAIGFCGSFVVSVYHTWTHDAPLLATIFGQWSLVALSVAYGTVGYHALRSADTPSERNLVGLWSGIGYGLAGLASGLYALHQHLTPEAALPFDSILFQATFVALVGGTAGIVLGLERSRRKRIVADLAASAEELESMQADIRTEKRRFESLFQNSPSAIADLQYDGGEPTVERANTAFEDLLDGTSAAVEGRNLFDLVPLRDAATEDEVAAHVRGDERYEGEVTIDRSDDRRHYKLRVIPYEVGKAGERAFALYTDVTELRKTREELEESVRRLEASNDRLERFAYAASHDLQEPLRTVSNYLRLIEDRYDDELDEDGRQFVEYAVDAADRMREMIDGLLEYSRVETRGESFRTVDLSAVVDDACTDLAVKFEESGAEVAVDDLPHVTGDGDQLRQVFQNMLENAIEYSGEAPPRVTIDAERKEAGDNEWMISVSDEGIGIDPDHRDEIFQVFNRLHTHEEHSGTGIGLALCERIVERHSGTLWVESEPGEGSTFYFTLPAATDNPEPRPVPGPRSAE